MKGYKYTSKVKVVVVEIFSTLIQYCCFLRRRRLPLTFFHLQLSSVNLGTYLRIAIHTYLFQ